MIIPIIPEELFELNIDVKPTFEGEAIIIDDIFKNYKDILDVCYNLPVEQWKSSPTTRNFKDYYDCRPIFANHFPPQSQLNFKASFFQSLIDFYFKVDYNIALADKRFHFNYFKHKNKNISNSYQFHPHYDMSFNVIFYIDPFENGGTAIYENKDIGNTEHENVLMDISNFSIKQIIQSKPNRCVIFPGHHMHGGYIENHDIYYHNWRINLVNFLKKA